MEYTEVMMLDGPVVGVLSPFAGGVYYGTLLAGICAAAARAGSRTIVVQTLDAAASITVNGGSPEFDAPVAWDHVAGFVVLADAVTSRYIERFRASGKPVVLLGHDEGHDKGQAGLPAVLADNGAGIREAVAHLVAHGHRRIAFTGNINVTDVAERYRAYRETLLAHGITPDPELFLPAVDNLESGVTWATPEALRGGPPAPAIVAATDRNAIGVVRAMTEAGLRCPDDYVITGFDDLEVAAFQEPGLASVRQLLGEMAAEAVGLLLRAVAEPGTPPARPRIPTAFVPRPSCGCASTTAHPAGAAPGAPDRLVERFSVLLPPEAFRTPDDLDALRDAAVLTKAVMAAAAAGDRPDLVPAARALMRIYELRPAPESLRVLSRAVQEYTQSLDLPVPAAARRVDICVQDLILATARLHHRAQFGERWRLRSTISAHYELSMALLYERGTDPATLTWLAATPASSGAVGLWTSDRQLRVPPAWRRRPGPPIGPSVLRVAQFPPAELVAAAGADETVFVVPAKVGGSDRGLLAIVDVVDSRVEDGRELVNQCAALFTVALDLREQEERLRQAALSDTLTGLPNRAAFVETLQGAASTPSRHFAVLFLDLDGFKQVNDTFGHAAGDELLVHVAERIRRSLRSGDVAARFGGDEFVVFLDEVTAQPQLDEIAERLRAAIAAPFHLAGRMVRIGVSIGATTRDNRDTADEILSAADAAMYRVKAGTR
ncbi:GGDEF domain-containing protein [Dactylosporangium sp. AC04546]|uniref:substrate-binding and GGDEF domain-containing protein n=1 Tax=Dactylosporangium sp. AC04546 TaxID=2862460 RepID=UPI001EE08482|nr:GGDEF domain-containing protein [Dactylosporangium sp. AC04546]WVK78995.1 GGDEF domain-containing protein [Dactylosporangium sp. AC04546]